VYVAEECRLLAVTDQSGAVAPIPGYHPVLTRSGPMTFPRAAVQPIEVRTFVTRREL